MTPFILRFQERCSDLDHPGVAAGTTTITAVHAEQIDADPDKKRHGAFVSPQNAGTATKTAIRAEGSDSDPGRKDYGALGNPINAGTATKTRVQAETSDEDRALCNRGMLRATGTPAATFVAREGGSTGHQVR